MERCARIIWICCCWSSGSHQAHAVRGNESVNHRVTIIRPEIILSLLEKFKLSKAVVPCVIRNRLTCFLQSVDVYDYMCDDFISKLLKQLNLYDLWCQLCIRIFNFCKYVNLKFLSAFIQCYFHSFDMTRGNCMFIVISYN